MPRLTLPAAQNTVSLVFLSVDMMSRRNAAFFASITAVYLRDLRRS